MRAVFPFPPPSFPATARSEISRLKKQFSGSKSSGVTVLFLMILIAMPFGHAQGDSSVDRLAKQFEGAKSRALLPVESEKFTADTAYAEQLDRLGKELMGKGDLEALLQVRKEREEFVSSKVIGGGDLDALAPLRKGYKKAIELLAGKRAEIEARLREVYQNALEQLQSSLTKSGNIEEALKAKKILDGLQKASKIEPGGSSAQIETKSPWSAPPPAGEEVLKGGAFLKPITLPIGRHRIRDKIVIGGREPARRNTIYILESTSISCADKGEIFVMAGQGNAFGVLFEGAVLSGGLAGDWNFINCTLERTLLAKGDGWKGKHQASFWKFDNCRISDDLFESWNTQDVGYRAISTTFDGVKFPDLEYRQEAGTLAQTDALLMKNCRFRKCDIPLSVLITTVNCAFEDCSFRDDARPFQITSPIGVTVFVNESTNRLRKVPAQIKVKIEGIEEINGEVGAQNTQ